MRAVWHHFISINIFFFVRNVSAVTLKHDEICFNACQESLSRVNFIRNSNTDGGYYPERCKNELRVMSMIFCAKVHCTSAEIIAGYASANPVCKARTNTTLPPYERFANVTQDYLSRLRHIEYGEDLREPVDSPALPSQQLFDLAYLTLATWAYEMNMHVAYGQAMYVFWGIVVLIGVGNYVFAMASFIPRQKYTEVLQGEDVIGKSNPVRYSKSSEWLAKYITTPAMLGRHCQEPLGWCTIPPRIESLTIASFVLINIVGCVANYRTFEHNFYWDDTNAQFWRYFSDRTGIMSFANMPLLWLFGMRNDVVMWLTGWSFGTFTNFHRWVSRVATIEAILHSLGYTIIALSGGAEHYWKNWTQLYWQAGVLATVLMTSICILSVYPIRRKIYEIFLRLHIGLAAVFLIGCYFHVIIFDGEYNGYIWPCLGLWAVDRLIRLIRILCLNLPFLRTQALATYNSDSKMIRVTIRPTMRFKPMPGTHFYLYMSNCYKGWESHPFTLVNWELSSPDRSISDTIDSQYPALTFLIRPYDNFTSRLRTSILESNANPSVIPSPTPLSIIIEGPYGTSVPLHSFASILFLVGGSGIAVALSYLRHFASSTAEIPDIRVVWCVREAAFVQDLEMELSSLGFAGLENLSLDAYVTGETGERSTMQARTAIPGKVQFTMNAGRPSIFDEVSDTAEAEGSLAVFGCGPARMVDEARMAVVKVLAGGREGIRYFEEGFEW